MVSRKKLVQVSGNFCCGIRDWMSGGFVWLHHEPRVGVGVGWITGVTLRYANTKLDSQASAVFKLVFYAGQQSE